MAQNITLLGASYPDVPAVELPKTGGGTASFDDTTDADATAADIATGKTAYVNGVKLTGTAGGGTVTSVSAGTGLTTSDGNAITSSGTVKAKLDSETSLGTIGNTSNLYALGVDSNGKLCTKISDITDEKVLCNVVSGTGSGYPILGTIGSAATRDIDTLGFKYAYKLPAAGTQGNSTLTLGNNKATNTANNEQGIIALFGTGTRSVELSAGNITAKRSIVFPDKAGTVALTSDIPELDNSVSSTSTTKAATANAVKTVNDYAVSLNEDLWHGCIILCGDDETNALDIWNGILTGPLVRTEDPADYIYNNASEVPCSLYDLLMEEGSFGRPLYLLLTMTIGNGTVINYIPVNYNAALDMFFGEVRTEPGLYLDVSVEPNAVTFEAVV